MSQSVQKSSLFLLILFFILITYSISPKVQYYNLTDLPNSQGNGRKINTLRQVSEDGGDTFAQAIEISLGTTNDEFNASDGYYDYYKINLNSAATIAFNLIGLESFILSIYDPSQTNLGSDSTGAIKHLKITVATTGYHYVELFRSSLAFEGLYNLTVSDPENGPDGGNSFLNATEISIGTFSDNFTTTEQEEYFKIDLSSGVDVIIDIYGECDDLYFYNSSQGLLERDPYDDPTIHYTVTTTGYYYIRLFHYTSSWGVYTLTVTTAATGGIFYADGGDNFTTARLVPLGEIRNRWTSADSWDIGRNDYFKVFLNAADLVTITLSSGTSSGYSLSVYDIFETSVASDGGNKDSIAQLVITTGVTGYYYLKAKSDYSQHAYSITISKAAGGIDGGDSFPTATEISTGIISGYLTNDERDDYFKILIETGNDVSISLTGECDDLYFYNSSQVLLERDPYDDPTIHYTVTATGYYYIRLSHHYSNWGAFILTVTTTTTGSIFYADGGDNFTTARLVPLGEIRNRWTSADSRDIGRNDYFKVFLNASDLITFILNSSTFEYYSLSVYDSMQARIISTSGDTSSIAQVVITVNVTSHYYVKVTSDYSGYDYSLIIAKTFYPSEPTNVQAIYDLISNIIVITWTDAPEPNLTYHIYMDRSVIEVPLSINGMAQISPKNVARKTILIATKIGVVQSGVQRFEFPNATEGTYYFAIVAENEHFLQSSITPGESATTEGLVVKYYTPSLLEPLLALVVIVLVLIGIYLAVNLVSRTSERIKLERDARSQRKYRGLKLEDVFKEDKRQLEELLHGIKKDMERASVEIHKGNFLRAKEIYKIIKNDFHVLEAKTTLSFPIRQKIRERGSKFKLEQKIRDMDTLAGYSDIAGEKRSIRELIKQGKLDNALQQYRDILQKLKVIAPAAKKYELQSLQQRIKDDDREINQLYLYLEEKLSHLIDDLDQPILVDKPIPKEERFYCQICSEYHSKTNESYYECTSCHRSQCLDCYLDSIKAGKNTCLFCNGSLEFYEKQSAERMEIYEPK